MDKIKAFYKKHPIISNVIFMFLASILLVWLSLLFVNLWTHHGSVSIVPDVKGLSYEEAAKKLRDSNLEIIISDSIYDRNMAPGSVVESWPKAGAEVKKNRAVYVSITAFSPKMITITMPVTGVSSRQAVSYLQALGVNSISEISVPSAYEGLVLDATVGGRQLFVGASIPVTADVILKVGSGMEEPPADLVQTDSLLILEGEDGMSGNSANPDEIPSTGSFD